MNKVFRTLILILGPLLFTILQLLEKPDSIPEAAWDVLGVTIWMAVWWVTEVVPIAVTALLPIILFPLTGTLPIESTTAAYGHKYVFLYLGGFMIAVAIERWNLHRRIALIIIHYIGSNIKFIILGFMVATAFLSMWISNTATSVMMLPIGAAIISQLQDDPNTPKNESALFGKALMLSIAYSASIGGIATLVGTPPNLVFAGVVEEIYGIKISFFKWTMVGMPISVLLLFICWKYLTKYAFKFDKQEFPGGREEIHRLKNALGKTGKQEKRVLIVFVLTAFFWITRSFLLTPFLPFIDDTIIAMIAAISLFIIPAGNGKGNLITWEEAVKIPWGIILLFGGGMALAKAFGDSGLAVWIGEQLVNLQALPLLLLLFVLVAVVNLLTEVTSNLATTAMLLPILATMALALNLHPYLLMVSATLAASCAFMLPVATPPNAVVFGSGHLRIMDMIRAGLIMNLISILIVTLFIYYLLPLIWDFDPYSLPKFMQPGF